MAGSDPILAVSRVFADLADDGGAAADSFATINSILKTSLNRTMLRFGKAMNDSVKSVQALNVGLKTASKRMSAGVTQKQSTRMGAASQANEAIHRTQAYYTNKQSNRKLNTEEFQNTLDDVNESIRSTLVNTLDEFAGKLSAIIPLLQTFSGVLGAITSVFSASTLNSAVSASKRSGAFSTTAKEKAAEKAAQEEYEKNKYKTPAERVDTVRANAKKGLGEINDKIKTEVNYITGIKIEQIKLANEYKNVLKGVTSLGKTPKEIANLFENLQDRLDKAKTYLSKLQTSRSNIEQAFSSQTSQAATKTVADIIMSVKSGASSMTTSVVKFVGALKASTVLMAGSFAAAIGFVVYKLYDFGKNAFPRLINYLQKPLQTVYEFVTGPLNQAFSKITSFVSTLNPAYGEQANRALEDLSAIVGKILLPVFNSMLSSLKVFTSFLSINSDRLKGTIQALANVIANMGAVLIGRFFILLGQAQPILEQLTAAFQRAIPIINNSLVKLFKEVQKYIPTFIQAINSLGMMLEMYLKQKLQEFANEAALASKAAQNQARAMQLFGNEAMTLSMAFNNLGYYLADFMLQLEAIIIELMAWSNFIVGRPQQGGIIGGLDVAGKVDERDLNIGEKAGAGVRKWIAGLFGAEDMPWVAKQPKPQPVAGEGEFDLNAVNGGDFGPGADLNLQEGFAAKGAAFQEIGQLGKNLAAASFGMGASVEDQQLNVQQQILQGVNGMLQNQNQFNGAAPVQGVR